MMFYKPEDEDQNLDHGVIPHSTVGGGHRGSHCRIQNPDEVLMPLGSIVEVQC